MDSKDLDEAFRGVMGVVPPADREVMASFYKESPDLARQVLCESAKVLMGAKSLAVGANDANFHRICADLILLSAAHPQVRQVFGVVSKADLFSQAGDRLIDPSMLPVVRGRIDRVMECLG